LYLHLPTSSKFLASVVDPAHRANLPPSNGKVNPSYSAIWIARLSVDRTRQSTSGRRRAVEFALGILVIFVACQRSTRAEGRREVTRVLTGSVAPSKDA
jgi:hypothetical protein